MKTWALLSFMACGISLLLCGCGGGSAPKPAAPAVSPLAGNWLITGPIPTTGVPFSGMGSGLFSLAMSFDVTDNNITASGYATGFCASNSTPPIYNDAFSFDSLTTGVIAADGSFMLQTPQNTPGYSLSIQGRVPEINTQQLAGTYAATFNSPVGPPCVGNSSGMFTATSFPLVSGVYTGTGNFQTATNGIFSAASPITMQVSLQQGATVLDPTTGLSKPSNIAIGGIIHVQGFPCFTSGTANTTLFPLSGPSSSIAGNILRMSFTMDDGSTLGLTGALTDSTESHISALLAVLPSEKCGAGSYFFPPTDLTRQN